MYDDSTLLCVKIFWKTSILYGGSLIPLFWTSGDICPGFQSQGGFSCLHALLPTCNEFIRFTPGTTVDFLVASMVAELFQSTYLHTSIGGAQVQDQACCLTACDKTSALPIDLNRLSYDD